MIQQGYHSLVALALQVGDSVCQEEIFFHGWNRTKVAWWEGNKIQASWCSRLFSRIVNISLNLYFL